MHDIQMEKILAMFFKIVQSVQMNLSISFLANKTCYPLNDEADGPYMVFFGEISSDWK